LVPFDARIGIQLKPQSCSPTPTLLRGPPTPSFPSAKSSGLPLPLAYLGAVACSSPFGRQPIRPQTSCMSKDQSMGRSSHTRH
jgi:hypothetical protein